MVRKTLRREFNFFKEMEKFTKIYKTERELLRKTGSVNAYEVYMHMKDSSSYYKGDFYDLTKCVAEYLDIPERSVKDAIKRLKEVGLIEVSKRGKVNIYKLPYAQESMEKQDKKEQETVSSATIKVAAKKDKDEGLIMEMEKNLTTAQINAALKDTRKDLSVSQNLKQIEYRLGWVLHKYSRAEREKYYKFLLKTA